MLNASRFILKTIVAAKRKFKFSIHWNIYLHLLQTYKRGSKENKLSIPFLFEYVTYQRNILGGANFILFPSKNVTI